MKAAEMKAILKQAKDIDPSAFREIRDGCGTRHGYLTLRVQPEKVDAVLAAIGLRAFLPGGDYPYSMTTIKVRP